MAISRSGKSERSIPVVAAQGADLEALSNLLENLSEVIYTADENGVLTYISPAIERLTDRSPSQVIGHPFSEFIHPQDLERARKALRRALSGEEIANEYRVVAKDGEMRWMRTSSQPILAGGRVVGVQGVLSDVTQRVLAEQRIREQSEFLFKVLESLTHPFCVIDANDYTVRIANPAARAAALPGQTTCYALGHAQNAPCATAEHPCVLEEIKKTKKPVTVEHIHYNPEGQARNVEVRAYPLLDAEGNVAQVIEYLLDVTEQRQATEAQRRREQRYRQLLDTLQEGIWVIDRDARTTFVNPRMAEMLGYNVEEMLGRHLFSFMDDKGVEIGQRNLERRQSGIKEQRDFEFLRKDGSRIYTVLETAPILDCNGTYTGTIAAIQDITERRRTEQALLQAKEAAEQASREHAERRQEAERRHQIAEGLAAVVAALNSNQPLPSVLQHIADQAMRLLGNQGVAIYGREGEEGDLSIQVARGEVGACAKGGELPPGLDALSQAVALRQPVAVPDLAGAHHQSDSDGGQAWLAVPILIQDEVYGGLVLAYADAQAFSRDEIELAAAFADQIALAVENSRLRDEAKRAAAAEERSRLARDLHDSVSQALFSASLVAEVLPQVWRRSPHEALEGLDELRHLTRGALAEMRTMLLELRPTAITETRLTDLLRQLTEAATSRVQMDVSLNIEPVPTLPLDVHVTFYRVAQEALHNIVKHAAASQVVVSLRASPSLLPGFADQWQGQVILLVTDNGQGFDPNQPGLHQLGLGIMRERAVKVGARLTVQSEPGHGTQVMLVWKGQRAHDRDMPGSEALLDPV